MAEHLLSKLLPRSTCRNSTTSLSSGEGAWKLSHMPGMVRLTGCKAPAKAPAETCHLLPPAASGLCYVRGMTDSSSSCCCPVLQDVAGRRPLWGHCQVLPQSCQERGSSGEMLQSRDPKLSGPGHVLKSTQRTFKIKHMDDRESKRGAEAQQRPEDHFWR